MNSVPDQQRQPRRVTPADEITLKDLGVLFSSNNHPGYYWNGKLMNRIEFTYSIHIVSVITK